MITFTSEEDLAEKWKAMVASERKPVFDGTRGKTMHSLEEHRIVECLEKHGELTANDLSVKLDMNIRQIQYRVKRLKDDKSIKTARKLGIEIYSVRGTANEHV